MTHKSILYGLSYSPWTERARWALDIKKVPYHYKEHSPLLGEYWLRFQARKSGLSKATVPLYVGGSNSIGDSFQIMRYADTVGEGTTLFPADLDIDTWRDKIEAAFEAMQYHQGN